MPPCPSSVFLLRFSTLRIVISWPCTQAPTPTCAFWPLLQRDRTYTQIVTARRNLAFPQPRTTQPMSFALLCCRRWHVAEAGTTIVHRGD
eukprot:2631603-Pleurochrysis_carterae.AAC.1